MSGSPKRQITHEYRAEAVTLVTEQGIQLTAAARKLSLSVQTYPNWVSKARACRRASFATGERPPR